MERLLFVVSGHSELEKKPGRQTGAHLGEITHAYEILRESGFEIDFVSPRGGPVPLDSVDMGDSINDRWYHDERFRFKIEHTMEPSQVTPRAYRGVYLAGGHGAMFDLASDASIGGIVSEIYRRGGIVAAVCHGVAGLLEAKEETGEPLVRGKDVTSFTNSEEIQVGLWDCVPFLLEDRLVEAGACHRKVDDFQKNVVVCERLITGQNPASATAVAEEMLKMLSKYKTSKLDIAEATLAP